MLKSGRSHGIRSCGFRVSDSDLETEAEHGGGTEVTKAAHYGRGGKEAERSEADVGEAESDKEHSRRLLVTWLPSSTWPHLSMR